MREKTTASPAAAQASEEVERSAELIERLLGDPDLRRRFRTDPAEVLRQHGLSGMASDLGHGRRALLTLELRESRSSLAGAMVAARPRASTSPTWPSAPRRAWSGGPDVRWTGWSAASATIPPTTPSSRPSPALIPERRFPRWQRRKWPVTT